MRILFFHPLTGYLSRGIERNTVELASCLADQGHDVSILTLHHPEQAFLDRLNRRVRLYEVPRSRYFSYTLGAPFFAWHLLQHSYDAVIVFFAGFGIGPTLALTRRLRTVPVYIFLGYPPDVAPHRYREIERWGLHRSAAGIWAHGEHVAEEVSSLYRRPVPALPSGVDVRQFSPDPDRKARAREILGLTPSDDVVVTVAALDERKGIQHVLRAIASIRGERPALKYLVAGDGPYKSALRQEILRLGLTDVTMLLGARGDIENVYWAGDIFCLPAKGEAGPIAVYEALAAGVPAIALASPHLQLHLPSDTVQLIDDLSPHTIAGAMLALLSDGARRASMARNGQRLVAERYSYAALTKRVAELLEEPSSRRRIA